MDIDELRLVGDALTRKPEHFTLERVLQKVLLHKKATIDTQKGISWGTAEALAIGTLLMDGIHCRLSGQDVQRGTFSHRHAVWHDQPTGETFTPLNNISDEQQQFFSLVNSPLSEFGVLGFELGYSWESPNQLVMWEAQFGDFANGAQVCLPAFNEKKLSLLINRCVCTCDCRLSSTNFSQPERLSGTDSRPWSCCFPTGPCSFSA